MRNKKLQVFCTTFPKAVTTSETCKGAEIIIAHSVFKMRKLTHTDKRSLRQSRHPHASCYSSSFFTLVEFTTTYNVEVFGIREMLACLYVIHVGLLKLT